MKIRIVSVGKIKERFFKEAQDEYLKMLSRFADVEIVELQDEKVPEDPSAGEIEAVLRKEGERIKNAVKGETNYYCMAIEGMEYDSLAFAKFVENNRNSGKNIIFIIGGSYGISDEIKKGARGLISFSKLTFPHRIARILLLEQLFRSFKIMSNEIYHK